MRELSVAGRGQREYDLRRNPRGESAGATARRRDVRAPYDPGSGRVDGHLLEGREQLGKLLVRPERRRAAGQDEGGQERVPRVADVRIHRTRAREGNAGPEVGGAAGPHFARGRKPERALG